MSKINIRSPYFVYDNSTTSVGSSPLAYATLNLWIYTGAKDTNKTGTPTYTLTATAIDGEVNFEISDFVSGYITSTFNGEEYSTDAPWVNYEVVRIYEDESSDTPAQTVLSAFDGYGYFEDGSNPQNSQTPLQSNTKIYTNDFSNINIPVHVAEDISVTYIKDGDSIFTKSITSTTNSADQIEYVSNSALDYDVFYTRVIEDGGEVEAFSCVKDIADGVYQEFDADKIYIEKGGVVEVITVEEIEECKYTPYKITFVNKFGALQDVWFFKRSNLSMNTQKESYKKTMVSGGTYSINKGQDTIFNKNATQTLSLNTGFYPEEYNEVFRQLYLSENIWIGFEGKTLPVTIKSQSFNYKTRLNDKLINYTIDIEFGFDKINNIR